MLYEQLSLLDLPVTSADVTVIDYGHTPESTAPKKVEAKTPIFPESAKFAAGDIVTIAPLHWEKTVNRKPVQCSTRTTLAGCVVGYNPVGMVLVQLGVGEPYACSEERCIKYDGVVSLWRLGEAVTCDRPDCQPKQSAKPFTCSLCEARSTPWWWYVGEMSTETKQPRWPDAVWFPSNYDPNTRSFEDQ